MRDSKKSVSWRLGPFALHLHRSCIMTFYLSVPSLALNFTPGLRVRRQAASVFYSTDAPHHASTATAYALRPAFGFAAMA